jgi:hypothetical protein
MALMLAASGGDPRREVIRRLMSGPLDWARLTRLAVDSHATPRMWAVVSAYPDLPDEARALQSIAVINDFRRYHIRNLVAGVVADLRAAGIEVLVIKGAAMLVGGVSNPVARTMSDIDILVLEGSPEEAWRVCRNRGWTPVHPDWTEELYRQHHHLPPLVDPDGIRIGLEIHRRLLPGAERLGVDVADWVARARTVIVRDTAIRVPSLEDLLLHDCVHFGWSNKLQRGAWRAVADAHLITADPGFNWDRFLAIATATSARRCCYWTLRLGRLLGDLPVPDQVLSGLDPTTGGIFGPLLERHFCRQILDPHGETTVSERVRRRLWLLATREPGHAADGPDPWSEGAVDVPGERRSSGSPRGPLQAILSTGAYLARLVARD